MAAETSYQMLELLSFCAESGGGLTSFNKDSSADFFNEKQKYNEAFRGFYFFRIRGKTLNQISYSQLVSFSNLKASDHIANISA